MVDYEHQFPRRMENITGTYATDIDLLIPLPIPSFPLNSFFALRIGYDVDKYPAPRRGAQREGSSS